MLKKIIKILLWVIVGIVGLPLLISVLLYLPPVQTFVIDRTARYLEANTGMILEVERFRLRFPLRLEMDNSSMVTAEENLKIDFSRLRVEISPWPLLRGKIKIVSLGVTRAGAVFRDPDTGFELDASIGEMTMRPGIVERLDRILTAERLELKDSRLEVTSGRTVVINDSTASSPLDWRFVVDRVGLENFLLTINDSLQEVMLRTEVVAGDIRNMSVDLGAQDIIARSVRFDRADISYFTSPSPPVPISEEADSLWIPWRIEIDNVEMDNSSFEYLTRGTSPARGFDPGNMQAGGIFLRAHSFYNRGSHLSAVIDEMALTERSGLEVTEASGGIDLDSMKVALSDFRLRTPFSSINVDGDIPIPGDRTVGKLPVDMEINGTIHSRDLFIFYPSIDPSTRAALTGRQIRVAGLVSGTLGDLNIGNLSLSTPGIFSVDASGRVRSLTSPNNLSGNLRFRGNFGNIGFVKNFIPDTALRSRIAIPTGINTDGSLVWGGRRYETPRLRIAVDTGAMELQGMLDLGREEYDLDLRMTDFPLKDFLPHDSLGMATLQLKLQGNVFDLRNENSSSWVDLNVDHFDYRGYNYHSLSLNALLEEHIVAGRLRSESLGLWLDLALDGEIFPERYRGGLRGNIYQLDLEKMGFASSPLSASVYLNVNADIDPVADKYNADAVLDSIILQIGEIRDKVAKTTVKVSADSSGVNASLNSGDIAVKFESPVGMNPIFAGLADMSAELRRQIGVRNIDMEPIQELAPPMKLEATAGRRNFLHTFMLSSQKLDFQRINITASTYPEKPLYAEAVVEKLFTRGVMLDTLHLDMHRNADSLDYSVKLVNRPGNLGQIALMKLYGGIADSTIHTTFLQRNHQGETGFNFSAKTVLLDSALRMELYPLNPVLGYKNWVLNEDNFFLYRFNKQMYTDIRLDGDNRHIHLYSDSLGIIREGALHIDTEGLDLGNMLQLLPTSPPLGGILSSDLRLGNADGMLHIEGEVAVDNFTYNSRMVGNIGTTLSWGADSLRNRLLDGRLSLDDMLVATVKGEFGPPDSSYVKLDAEIPEFPLALASVFVPEESVLLSGMMHGELKARGTTDSLDLDGKLYFSNSRIFVPITGTTFRISEDTILLERNNLVFDDFGLLAPNNRKLALDGNLDMTTMSNVTADMSLFTTDFQAVGSTWRGGSQIFGTANLDADITAVGPINNLTVRGGVRLLSSTDITYTLRNAPLGISSRKQDIVTFISFADTAALAARDSLAKTIRTWGMDMLINGEIDQGVEVTMNLSEDGNNRVELVGEGSLMYHLNNRGDSRLTGRYTLSGGRVLYNPPIIAQKNFAVNPGSYVEWRGDVSDPLFNITATQSVRTTVRMEDGTSSVVNFNITIALTNTLQDMDVTFDLAAPGDLTIQNQLSSLTPEQRSQQALSLMIYNTYTGPGATVRVDASNPLNAFIAKEINQWARGNLRNVDFSLGVNTYDDVMQGGRHTAYSYRVSTSLFSDRVTVSIGGSLNTGQSTQNMDPNLRENFVEDIVVEYRLSSRDNMFIRIYRLNTQQSMLEGEVVETGVGFHVRKRMNRFGELFQVRRSPEKRQASKEKQEQKRQLREQERAEEAEKRLLEKEAEVLKDTESAGPDNGSQAPAAPDIETNDAQ